MSTTPPGGTGDGVRGARAIVLLVVTVVVAVVVLRHVGTTTTAATASAASGSSRHATATTTTTVPVTTTTTVPTVPPASVKLLVLNGTGAGNLATETTDALKASHGYDVLAPDNTTSTVTTSVIYATSATYVGSADALATAVGLPVTVVQSSIPVAAPIRATERAIADVVLVIGPGFTIPSSTPTTTATSAPAG